MHTRILEIQPDKALGRGGMDRIYSAGIDDERFDYVSDFDEDVELEQLKEFKKAFRGYLTTVIEDKVGGIENYFTVTEAEKKTYIKEIPPCTEDEPGIYIYTYVNHKSVLKTFDEWYRNDMQLNRRYYIGAIMDAHI